MKRKVQKSQIKSAEYDGSLQQIISTGSTLLDLAISGGRVRGGGLPGGILVEIFGPSGSGKTVLLSEIGGNIQRTGGEVIFRDPEARLNKQFAKMFGLEVGDKNYTRPNTVPEVFKALRDWKPKRNDIINGCMADSLAALSTDMEMENEEGDKMGGRRAKEFSEQLRKTARIITDNNFLMVCSNQIRENMGATFGPKWKSPGGEAIGFYSSLRLKTAFKLKGSKITQKQTYQGKKIKRIIGVGIEIEVFKSSVWEPYRTAPLTILFDYGIDDIRENLQFIKDYTGSKTYTHNGERLAVGMEKAIEIVETEGLVQSVREEVINLWEEIEKGFKTERKEKQR